VQAHSAEPDGRDPDWDPDADRDTDAHDQETDLTEREVRGEFGPDVPIDDLVLLIDDDNPLVRRRGLDAIYSRNPQAGMPHLVRALGDDDFRVSDLAVEILGRLTDPASMKLAGDALAGDTDTAVRIRAFMVVAMRAADPMSEEYVRSVAKDENQFIREAASQFQAEMDRRRRR
jgi:hypothetical protein